MRFQLFYRILDKKNHNLSASQMKHFSCHLKSVHVGALEMLELRSEGNSSRLDSNDRQVCVAYSDLFNAQYTETKPCTMVHVCLGQSTFIHIKR